MFPSSACRLSPKRVLASAVCLCSIVYLLISLDFNGGNFADRTYKSHRLDMNKTAEEEEEKEKEDSTVNETWVKMRTELLRESRVTKVFMFTYMRGGSSLFAELFNLDPKRSVLFFEPLDAFYQSYAALYPHAIPLSLLYGNDSVPRSLSEREIVDISDYLESLLTCRIDRVPVETFAHNYFGYSKAMKQPAECMARKYSKTMVSECMLPIARICGRGDPVRRDVSTAIGNKCPEMIGALKALLPDMIHPLSNKFNNLSQALDYLTNTAKVSTLIDGFSIEDEQRLNAFVKYHMCKAKAKFILSNCMYSIESTCKRASLIALKVIRSRMKDLEILIQRIPDIHVIYYTRDPRAIANSRLEMSFPLVFSSTDRSVSAEAKILCHRMWEDAKAKKLLERKYPGSITTIRYEDFVRDLNGTALRVYETLGYEPPVEFYRWVNVTQRGSTSDGIFGTKRPNATASIERWKRTVSFHEGVEMSRHCARYLTELGYEVY